MIALNKKKFILFNFLCAALLLTSCNDDFSEVGSSLVDNNNFDANLYETSNLTAESQKITRVQTNTLPTYEFGSYQDQVFGTTQANLLTQVSLNNPNPQFEESTEVDSVILSIPFYSTVTEQTVDGRTYRLDSVFGEGNIDFSIYRSNYSLRQFDPSSGENTQAYYSDQTQLFESNLALEPIVEVENFRPSSRSRTVIIPNRNGTADTTTVAPQMRIALPADYFQDLIIDNNSEALVSNANFREFFRGLYFKVEGGNFGGVMSFLNFASDQAKITLFYNYDITNSDTGEDSNVGGIYELNFGPVRVNTYQSEYNSIPEEENLYLKGNAGSVGVIDLFPDQDELDSLRNAEWLVNEANLKLYVNQQALPVDFNQPERIFIYNYTDGSVLSDYQFATDVLNSDIVNSRRIHLGRLTEDENGNYYYKIRITNYMNQLLAGDSDNTLLGLSVSSNVNIPLTLMGQTNANSDAQIPAASVVSPLGTILYGTEAPTESQQLQLEIYYTEANN